MMRKEILVNVVWISIFAVAAILHILGINQPFLGNFAQHQTDYATVVQRWLSEISWNPLVPTMRFIGNGENRIFLGDLPLNINLVAVLCRFMGWPIESVGRGLSAFLFLTSLYPLHRLLSLLFKDRAIVSWSLLFYICSPLTLIYGQSFLLEMTGLSFAIFGYYYFFRWYQCSSKRSLICSALFFSLTLGTRIYYAPILLPIIYLMIQKLGRGSLLKRELYYFCILAFIIPLGWQGYAAITAGGQGGESSLQDNLRVFVFDDPIMRQNLTSFKYYLPVFQILLAKVLTPLGFVLTIFALCAKKIEYKKHVIFIVWLTLSFALLFIIAPRKFIEFEYYYLPLVPGFAILAGIAIKKITSVNFGSSWGKVFLGGLLLLLAARYSLPSILGIPDEDRHVVAAGQEVQVVVPEGSRIVVSHGSSSAFLYYTNRDGWNLYLRRSGKEGVRNMSDKQGTIIEQLERFRSQGAAYYAITDKRQIKQSQPFFDYLSEAYPLIHKSPNVLIYSLNQAS